MTLAIFPFPRRALSRWIPEASPSRDPSMPAASCSERSALTACASPAGFLFPRAGAVEKALNLGGGVGEDLLRLGVVAVGDRDEVSEVGGSYPAGRGRRGVVVAAIVEVVDDARELRDLLAHAGLRAGEGKGGGKRGERWVTEGDARRVGRKGRLGDRGPFERARAPGARSSSRRRASPRRRRNLRAGCPRPSRLAFARRSNSPPTDSFLFRRRPRPVTARRERGRRRRVRASTIPLVHATVDARPRRHRHPDVTATAPPAGGKPRKQRNAAPFALRHQCQPDG